MEARPLCAKTSRPVLNPSFTASTSHLYVVTRFGWAHDRPGNGRGGVRDAPALGVMGTVDRRDGEVAQRWSWRVFDRLVAKGCLRFIECMFSMAPALYSALASRSPSARSRSSQAFTITHPKCAPLRDSIPSQRHIPCSPSKNTYMPISVRLS